jgi:hypothetical protein
MTNIQIIRLQSGEDVIGDITVKENGTLVVYDPMVVLVDYRNKVAGMVMRPWLPMQLIKKNNVTLRTKDILFVVEPTDELVEYYISGIEKLHQLLYAKDIMKDLDDEDYEEVMDAFEELQQEGHTIQ